MSKNKFSNHAIYSIILLSGLLSGCSTNSALTYSVSPDNVMSLRKINSKVAVGEFTSTQAGLRQIDCRMVGPVEPPDGLTFSEYIRKAFIGELQMAEKYDPYSKVILNGNVDRIEMSSYSGTWNIDMTLSSKNGKKIYKSTTYDYKSNFVGEIACQKAALALQPAVQNLIKSFVADPEFSLLIK